MKEEWQTLTWQTYPDHLKEIMHDLLTTDDCKDVTLVSDDMKSIKAHRNILSACSPLFKNIFQMENDNYHTVVFLQGMPFSEIESIIQLIYLGQAQVNCHEDKINEFFTVAKHLQIKELLKDNGEPQHILKTEVVSQTNPIKKKNEKIDPVNLPNKQQHIKFEDLYSVGGNYKCPQCEKCLSNKSVLLAHVKGQHQGIKYACTQCQYKATQQSNLKKHILSVHEGVKYDCNQCDFKAARQDSLTVHIQAKHEGVKFPCSLCNYQFTRPNNLASHVLSVHEGVRYNCNQCDRHFSQKIGLTSHIKAVHEGMTYPCDKCDFLSAHKHGVTRHKLYNCPQRADKSLCRR